LESEPRNADDYGVNHSGSAKDSERRSLADVSAIARGGRWWNPHIARGLLFDNLIFQNASMGRAVRAHRNSRVAPWILLEFRRCGRGRATLVAKTKPRPNCELL